MTAIEFENISKQYRLGLVSTGTLSHDLNRFWQTKVLRRDDPYLKVGETNDRAHKGNSESFLGVSPAMPGPGRRGIKSPSHTAIFPFRGPRAIDQRPS